MKLYLDSVDLNEIEQAVGLGVVSGLTTTPTFMHRHGISDVEGTLVRLSSMVPELHVEAIGDTHDEIVEQANRLLELDFEREPVFKVPVSNEGVRACRTLTSQGHRVNVHLVYTLTQAYMAMIAGAAFVCPLAGRLQDQGHDAIGLFEQCMSVRRSYAMSTQVMFSSVRHTEHVRQALLTGVDVCTVPWSVMKRLCENELTSVGTAQFMEHTRLITTKVREIIRPDNPVCRLSDTVVQALVKMTGSRLGAVALVDEQSRVAGVFTDGDVRRNLQEKGEDILSRPLGELNFAVSPITISADARLDDAVELFKQHKVDNIVVVEDNAPVGILDVQDLVKLGLVG